MKKLFVPALLLLSLTGLVACGSDNSGFVKNGVAYREGDASKVSEEVKTAKDGKIKTVTQSLKMDMYLKASAQGESSTIKETMTGDSVIDIDNKVITGDYKINYSINGTKDTAKLTFRAEEEDGYFFITTFTGPAENEFTSESLTNMYEGALTNVYSWNYVVDAEDISALASKANENGITETQLKNLYNKIVSSVVISGDVSTGTFEVGLGKKLDVTLGGVPLSYTKLKTTYEEGLLKSNVMGISANYKQTVNGTSVSVKMTESLEYNFSYTFRD